MMTKRKARDVATRPQETAENMLEIVGKIMGTTIMGHNRKAADRLRALPVITVLLGLSLAGCTHGPTATATAAGVADVGGADLAANSTIGSQSTRQSQSLQKQSLRGQSSRGRSSSDARYTALAKEAQALMSDGNHKAALPIFRHLVRVSGRTDHKIALAQILLNMGRAGDALAIIGKQGLQPSIDLHMVRGEALLATGQFREALLNFDQALMLGAGEDALTGRGIAYTALGENEAALADFRQVSPPVGPSNEALVMIITGRNEDAIGLLEALVDSGEAGPRDRQNLVFAYVATGRDEEARRLAHIDLDSVTARQTIGYYRMLATLTPTRRVDSLLLGVVTPAQDRRAAGNYQLADGDSEATRLAARAGERLLADMRGDTMLAEAEPAPKPQPEPKPEPEPVLVAAAEEEPGIINGEDLRDIAPEMIPPVLEVNGWSVQIGAYRTIRRMSHGWQQLLAANEDILEDIPPRRSEINYETLTKTGKKGFYYRLNAGPLKDLDAAKALCAELETRNTACWVRPPEEAERRPERRDGMLTASTL